MIRTVAPVSLAVDTLVGTIKRDGAGRPDYGGFWGTVMAIETGNDTTLDLRLPAGVKEAVEQAAAHLGQSVDDFAVSALAQTAREVIEQRGATVLTVRDWERLLALLDAPAEPNAAIKAAAERYKQQFE
jgi:uncharacterized protein (DUF1778 family)